MARALQHLLFLVAAAVAGCSSSGGGQGAASDAGLQDRTTAACGAVGAACCSGTACNAGLVCSAGACAPACGGAGQPCCNGTACNAMLTCSAGSCTGAGVNGGDGASGPVDSGAGGTDSSPSDASPTDGAPSPCDGGLRTSISGRVYDPANVNPLYDVVVYVPGGPLGSLPGIPSCGTCDSLYTAPLASTLTDATGRFQLLDVPSGSGVPLVVQIGKWRMKYTIATVAACQDNPQADHSLRLPRNHTEGDLPQIAISTGGADTAECVPLRMGVDPGEYVSGAGTPGGGHVHIFASVNTYPGASTDGGTSPGPSVALWDKLGDIVPYDLVLFSCEGAEPAGLTSAAQAVLWSYTQNGGRVLATHFHYAWFTSGPFATMVSPALATWTAGTGIDNDPIGGIPVTTLADGSPFAEGQGFAFWLGDAGALQSGKVPTHYGRHNAQVGAANALS